MISLYQPDERPSPQAVGSSVDVRGVHTALGPLTLIFGPTILGTPTPSAPMNIVLNICPNIIIVS